MTRSYFFNKDFYRYIKIFQAFWPSWKIRYIVPKKFRMSPNLPESNARALVRYFSLWGRGGWDQWELGTDHVTSGRDGKTYKRASNACVNFFLAWVNYEPNFTLFCRESELCCNFVLLWVILMAFHLVSFYFYFKKRKNLN